MVGHWFDDRGTGGDQAAFADGDTLNDRCAGADMRAVANAYAAGQDRAGCDVDVRADEAVVIHGGANVDQRIVADAATGLNDGACHDLDAFAERDAGGHHGSRMDDLGEPVAFGLETIERGVPAAAAGDRPQAVDQIDRRGRAVEYRVLATEEIYVNRDAGRTCRIMAAAAHDAGADQAQRVDQDTGMASEPSTMTGSAGVGERADQVVIALCRRCGLRRLLRSP